MAGGEAYGGAGACLGRRLGALIRPWGPSQGARDAVGARLLRVKPVEFGSYGGAEVYLGGGVSFGVCLGPATAGPRDG